MRWAQAKNKELDALRLEVQELKKQLEAAEGKGAAIVPLSSLQSTAANPPPPPFLPWPQQRIQEPKERTFRTAPRLQGIPRGMRIPRSRFTGALRWGRAPAAAAMTFLAARRPARGPLAGPWGE